jgi:predicted permease
VASIAASLYPALRLSGIDPNRALKSGGSAGTGRGQHRLRAGFVIAQVALTLVLVVVAGLLIRTVTRYRHADLGFDPTHILAAQLSYSPPRYEGRDVIANFYQPLLDRVAHLPGIRAAGLIDIVPIDNWGSNSDIHIVGQPPNPPNQEMLSESRVVSAGYFDVFGIPFHRGRALSPSLDGPGNTPAFVVNEAFVKKFIPNGLDPIGQRIEFGKDATQWPRIVGVTGSVRQNIYEPPLAEHDSLMEEFPLNERGVDLNGYWLVVRADGDPRLLIPAIRSAVHEVDPTASFDEPRTMTEIVTETLVFDRMESWLFGIFAAMALVLALVGIYGLVSHEVELSTRDIGVRMALGASRSGVFAMVLRRMAWMLGLGTIAGLALAVAVRKLIGIVIYFDAQKESGSLLLIALLLVAAGLLAAMIPAGRAASVDPMRALRAE